MFTQEYDSVTKVSKITLGKKRFVKSGAIFEKQSKAGKLYLSGYLEINGEYVNFFLNYNKGFATNDKKYTYMFISSDQDKPIAFLYDNGFFYKGTLKVFVNNNELEREVIMVRLPKKKMRDIKGKAVAMYELYLETAEEDVFDEYEEVNTSDLDDEWSEVDEEDAPF